jgi:serine acetyltransferase
VTTEADQEPTNIQQGRVISANFTFSPEGGRVLQRAGRPSTPSVGLASKATLSAAVTDDLRNMTAAWDASVLRLYVKALSLWCLHPRIKAVVSYRVSAWCWHHRLRVVGLWIQARTIRATGAEIHPAAEIGPGLALNHTVGIVIGHEVRAGRNLLLHQGVTLGHGPGQGQPIIGDSVRIGAGAIVLGPTRIGNRVVIGAGAIVLADVPDDTTVVGTWKGAPRPGLGATAVTALVRPA